MELRGSTRMPPVGRSGPGTKSTSLSAVALGNLIRCTDLARMIPPMATQAAPHLEFAGQIRQKLSVPVMHAARIADVATARYAITEGLLDLVGMTRALMADPELPNKVRTGRADEIRPCVGANMCIDGIYNSGSAFCIHNPSTGRELEVPQRVVPASTSRRVAVVGAGPAGLEAARVLGERGHDVQVYEASSRAGASSCWRRGRPVGVTCGGSSTGGPRSSPASVCRSR